MDLPRNLAISVFSLLLGMVSGGYLQEKFFCEQKQVPNSFGTQQYHIWGKHIDVVFGSDATDPNLAIASEDILRTASALVNGSLSLEDQRFSLEILRHTHEVLRQAEEDAKASLSQRVQPGGDWPDPNAAPPTIEVQRLSKPDKT